ncbi:hypothetical protein HZC30_02705 [Candidatus Woesearchaeota archaeon]|nr:hypothetical protein [Candidatus Woesearchaeota archaeon]
MKKLTLLLVIISLVLASSALAVDFGLSCPNTVTSNAPFECEVKMPSLAIQLGGLLGLSFTIETNAKVNSVSFPIGNDASVPPTYAFFTTTPISAPGTVIAKISLTKSSSGSITIKGVQASLENKIKIKGNDLVFPTETFTVGEGGAGGNAGAPPQTIGEKIDAELDIAKATNPQMDKTAKTPSLSLLSKIASILKAWFGG